MSLEDLRKNGMMAHLIEALDAEQDIGHYGRLVFVMVARHFLSEQELLTHLRKNPGFDESEARGLCHQVKSKGYSPPKRERILEWQQQQEFPLCPDPEDPDGCNVYKDLQFPEEIYDHITDYHDRKAKG